MRAGRDEVLDIFRKWLADKVFVRVQGSFALFAFGLWGFITSVEPHELRIMNVETETEFILRLNRDIELGYGDNRIVTGEEKRFSECIIAFPGPIPETGTPDTIAIAALITS